MYSFTLWTLTILKQVPGAERSRFLREWLRAALYSEILLLEGYSLAIFHLERDFINHIHLIPEINLIILNFKCQ